MLKDIFQEKQGKAREKQFRRPLPIKPESKEETYSNHADREYRYKPKQRRLHIVPTVANLSLHMQFNNYVLKKRGLFGKTLHSRPTLS